MSHESETFPQADFPLSLIIYLFINLAREFASLANRMLLGLKVSCVLRLATLLTIK